MKKLIPVLMLLFLVGGLIFVCLSPAIASGLAKSPDFGAIGVGLLVLGCGAIVFLGIVLFGRNL